MKHQKVDWESPTSGGLVAALLVVLVIVSIGGCSEGPTEPQVDLPLQLSESTFDFGDVPQGTIVEHNYKLCNYGPAVASILKIKPGCGCLQAIADGLDIGSGRCVEITVRYNSGSYVGLQSRAVEVLTNSEPSRLVIEVTANVVP